MAEDTRSIADDVFGSDQPSQGSSSTSQSEDTKTVADEVFDSEDREPTTQSGEEVGAVREAVSNIIPSSFDAMKNIWQMVSHPIDTAVGIAKLGTGAAQKLIPGKQDSEENFDAFIDFMDKRYGGLEEIENTFRKDPAGFFLDGLSVLSAGGSATTRVGVAKQSAKIQRAGNIISKTAAPVRTLVQSRTPINSLVKSVLKFGDKKSIQKRDELTQSFIDNGFNINRKSRFKIVNARKDIHKKIRTLISKETADGVEINTKDISQSIDKLIKNASEEGFKLPDLKALETIKNQFEQQHGAVLTPSELQKIKMGLNRGFNENIGQEFAKAKGKADDVLRDAAMQRLQEIHPSIKTLNAESGALKEISEAIKKAIIKHEDRDIPIKGLLAGGLATGGLAIGTLGAGVQFAVLAIIAESILSSPRVQITTARALNIANKGLAKTGKLTVGSFQAGRTAIESKTEGKEE